MTTQQSPSSPLSPLESQNLFKPNLKGRYRKDWIFQALTWAAVAFAVTVLAVLIFDTLIDALPRLEWSFLTSFPSRKPEQAGIYAALTGTVWVMIIVALISFPLGVGAGIYLEEFATDNWITRIIEINISNLAGVPSIIYGLLGLAAFVRLMEPITGGRSVLAGALTLILLILPVIIVSTRESLRAVPESLRLAGFALGSTRWQVVREHVLPMALPGVLTGMILALSRAIGETAPLITIGALTFVPFVPQLPLAQWFQNPVEAAQVFWGEGIQSPFTVLPIQVYNWVSRPQKGFHTDAAAGIIVLLVVLLAMNSIAIVLRDKLQKTR
ncbi:phosphate ABC transporter permease PstA [Prochlorothrix hollandica]|uniref:Phosphate transport system permease protein PstA n=3 Tax=Prochlorothrix hollandica TaxID=1223 RepID=A0A0M2PX77_PROHO|nr:phosphate ABC transporter permease PstA [Prochlorothrix hollandica]KKI99273.1 phosphate ABC transporter permease [Prochlorothrix hollandica PCC 9006 = CALU 1027]